MARIPRSRRSVALVLLALLVFTGCGRRERYVLRSRYRIKAVELVGVTRFKADTFLQHLHIGETSWVPLSPTYHQDDGLTALDVVRVEELYHSYGYLDVQVLGVETRLDRKRRRATLRIVVDEGPVVRVRKVDVHWSPDSPIPMADRGAVEKVIRLSVGGPWEVGLLNASVGNLTQALRKRGYPLARARGSAEVHRSVHRVDVLLKVDPGPAAVLSGIRFEGLERVPEVLVRNETDFALGAPYTPALVRQVEKALKGMRVFRWVAAQPPTRVDHGGVEITVRLNEADPQRLRVGTQFSIETNRWQEQVALEYSHSNLFRSLTRLDLLLSVGWAELPNPWAPRQHGPVLTLEPRFTKKGLLEKHLVWELVPRFDVDIQEGYQYYSPREPVRREPMVRRPVPAGCEPQLPLRGFLRHHRSLGHDTVGPGPGLP